MLRAFVNCAMMLKKRLNFFYFQWQKVDQVRSEYLRSYLNWLHNWQLKSTRRSHTLKGSQSMGDGRTLLKPGRDDSFKKVLSNEPNFSRIHLAGQYLLGKLFKENWLLIEYGYIIYIWTELGKVHILCCKYSYFFCFKFSLFLSSI